MSNMPDVLYASLQWDGTRQWIREEEVHLRDDSAKEMAKYIRVTAEFHASSEDRKIQDNEEQKLTMMNREKEQEINDGVLPKKIYIDTILTSDGEPHHGMWTIEKRAYGCHVYSHEEDTQILELVRLVEKLGFKASVMIGDANDIYNKVAVCLIGEPYDEWQYFESISDAIIELRSRLEPPQRPTAEEYAEFTGEVMGFLLKVGEWTVPPQGWARLKAKADSLSARIADAEAWDAARAKHDDK